MSKIEQLRKWQAKLQEQILEEEASEKGASKREYISTLDFLADGLPPVLCPVCGEATCKGVGETNADGDGWEHLSSRCRACHTDFRIGQVSHRCALCYEPFRYAPYDDINEFHHHLCGKDRQCYCTPCFMQLFFDDCIDLSSSHPEFTDDTDPNDYAVLRGYRPTYVGNTVAPFRSRLAANGYEEVALVKERDDIEQICRRVAQEGRRYLVLISGKSEKERHYIVYQTGGKAEGAA